MLGSWPSFDPHNFSQFKSNDPSNPSEKVQSRIKMLERLDPRIWQQMKDKEIMEGGYIGNRTHLKMTPVTYHPTHDRTLPPPDQVIAPEAKNILVRHFYQQNGDEKLSLSSKRASSQNQTADRASKLARTSASQNV